MVQCAKSIRKLFAFKDVTFICSSLSQQNSPYLTCNDELGGSVDMNALLHKLHSIVSKGLKACHLTLPFNQLNKWSQAKLSK